MSGPSPSYDHELDGALTVLRRRLQQATPESIASTRSGAPVDLARSLYRERRVRDRYLNPLVEFAEPGWDIVLDLFIARAENRRVSVSSACIAAAVPSTTGLRWLSLLENRGTIIRESDEVDRRKTYVRLSDRGWAAVGAYLSAITTKSG